jgi:purine-cytosine permease-like protein
MENPKPLSEQLDALYEYDREPVSNKKLIGFGSFLGLYAGEHVAGTEFVIGPLFVAHGVTAKDLFLGLLVGNILAVLSFALLVAPVAVRTRLTLYWHLRQVAGPRVTFIYSIVNGLMFCILAGAMIAVGATAVGLPFNMPMPQLDDVYPTSVSWVVVVFSVGALVTVLAIWGFEKISHFSNICAPWMFLLFIACALAVLPSLGCHSFGDFWRVATEVIWTGTPMAGHSKFTFWHIAVFTWLLNIPMHIGMSDMSILRYAKKWQHGFASASGMFLGHYIAWIASGILFAAAARELAPGPMAYVGAGFVGAVGVLVTSWTTANPTLYRAGLALQAITPDWKRWKVTLVAGGLTTLAACFPGFIMKFFEFIAVEGLSLMPIGVVILTDYWILPLLGLRPNLSAVLKGKTNWAAAITWVGTTLACLFLVFQVKMEIFFVALPGIVIAVALYCLSSWFIQKSLLRAQAFTATPL